MTDRQLAKRVEKWRKRLVPDWRVILLKDFPAEEGDDSPGMGRVLVNSDLRQMKVWINLDEHLTARETEETIAHELLHALVQPVEDVFDSARTSLSVAESLQLGNRLDSVTEPLVERLSRVMVALEHRDDAEGTAWE